MSTNDQRRRELAAVLIAALGYFIDVYDQFLFGIVRLSSLRDIGVAAESIPEAGLLLTGLQTAGILVGGLAWGIFGDRAGRLPALFGSIALFSLANIANAFVHTVPAYAALRFIAGVGFAGQLGAGVTLVCERMSRENRGYGTMAVVAVGFAGGVAALLVGDRFGWRNGYLIAGAMGLALLTLRFGVREPDLFAAAKRSAVRRGDFFMLFSTPGRLRRYLSCIALGMPFWFVIRVLAVSAPEFGAALGMPVLPTVSRSVLWVYAGLALGAAASGGLSQRLRGRLTVARAFVAAAAVASAVYLNLQGASLFAFYSTCFALGFFSGYWAVFVTITAEQFGTNLRATAATTAPSFARGALIAVYALAQFLSPDQGMLGAAGVAGALCFALALAALFGMGETFGKRLDYLEKAG